MRWASSLSVADELAVAVREAADALDCQLDGARCDLVFAFVSREHRDGWHELPGRLRERFPGALVLGSSASGVIGDAVEVEQRAGLALAAVAMPGVERSSFHLPAERTPDPCDDPEAARAAWDQALGLDSGPDPHLILLADPFTWAGPELLAGLDQAYPGGVKIGGLCSGGARPGEHRLFCDRSAHHRGLVGVALRGPIELEAVVAQGCTPIGAPMFVTRHQQQVVFELDGRPAIVVLRELFEQLPPRDLARARNSLLLGVTVGPPREVYGPGDFLVRDLVGIDPNSGALATATPLGKNAVVQFHLRDAETAAAELRELVAARASGPRAAGALLFSCLARGRGLYGEPGHDSALVRELLGPSLPIAGFFGNGEIGPIAGQTHVHGHTSAVLLAR